MSRTYSLGCKDCKVHVWIAQASIEIKTLYYGEPKTMELLKQFLFDHQKHNLVFDENCESEIGDWTELENPEPPADPG